MNEKQFDYRLSASEITPKPNKKNKNETKRSAGNGLIRADMVEAFSVPFRVKLSVLFFILFFYQTTVLRKFALFLLL